MKYTESPYQSIPYDLLESYSCENKIPILNWYADGTNDLKQQTWSDEYINNYKKYFSLENVRNHSIGITEDYPGASQMLLTAFDHYKIQNKKIAVIGSISPWIEAMLLNLNNEVTTVEFNVPETTTTQLKCISYWDFQKNDILYDCIVTYSSIEHSGLGRYGDPLDPDGDLKCMNDIHKSLVKDGILVWGAPVGHDAVVWNVHRIYGKIRLPMMFENFVERGWIGCDRYKQLNEPLRNNAFNPVVVLTKM